MLANTSLFKVHYISGSEGEKSYSKLLFFSSRQTIQRAVPFLKTPTRLDWGWKLLKWITHSLITSIFVIYKCFGVKIIRKTFQKGNRVHFIYACFDALKMKFFFRKNGKWNTLNLCLLLIQLFYFLTSVLARTPVK